MGSNYVAVTKASMLKVQFPKNSHVVVNIVVVVVLFV